LVTRPGRRVASSTWSVDDVMNGRGVPARPTSRLLLLLLLLPVPGCHDIAM